MAEGDYPTPLYPQPHAGMTWNSDTGVWEDDAPATPTAPSGPITNASTQDTRTQEERIAAGDSPQGSTEYQGTSGRIDNTIGDTAALEAQLKAEAAARGVAYDPSDLEGILRNTGYQTGGVSVSQALANQLGIYDQRALYDGISVADRGPYINGMAGSSGGTSGGAAGGTSGGSDPFASAFGAVPAPYGDTYTTLARPDYLQGAYVPPTWDQSFTAPTLQDVQNSPGYQTRLAAGQNVLERSAAAKGSILSGGFQEGLNRYAQDYGSNEYANEYARRFQDYQQRYGQFSDSAALGLQARGLNENTYQADVNNNRNQYSTRYQQYLDAITNTRNAENDLWNRNQDLVQNSLQAAALARP